MKNQVIEVLDKEHGKKVIEYWRSKGVDTKGYKGILTREYDNFTRFYGVINGWIGYFDEDEVKAQRAEIIALPEANPYPKVMWVWTRDEKYKLKRVVFAEKNGWYLAWDGAKTLEEAEEVMHFSIWENAEDIQCSEETNPKPVELSDREILSRGLDILAAYIKSLGEVDGSFKGVLLFHDISGHVQNSYGREVFAFDGKEYLMSQICEKLGIDE